MTFIRAWNETTPTGAEEARLLSQIERDIEVDFRQRFVVFPGDFVVPGQQETPDGVFGDVSRGVAQLNVQKLLQRWNGSTRLPAKAGFSQFVVLQQIYNDYASGPVVQLSRDQVFTASGNYVLEAWVFTSTPVGSGSVSGAFNVGLGLGSLVTVSTGVPSFGYLQVHFTYPTQFATSTLTLVTVAGLVQVTFNFSVNSSLPVTFDVTTVPGVPWPSGFSFTVYGPFVRMWKVN